MKRVVHEPITRRAMLRLLGTAAGITLTGCRDAQRAPAAAFAAAMPSCVVRPEQTEGPYFLDAKLNRSDIRADPEDGSVKPGVPLRVVFDVGRVAGATCAPLAGAILDLWQCDALGVYSGVRDRAAGFDARGGKFLRGFQTTGVSGRAEFLTIYPGWYPGRAVHIHFKIRVAAAGGRFHDFTSQIYFDDSVTDSVHRASPYQSKTRARTRNEEDFLFRRGGTQLMPVLSKQEDGYTARFAIGLQL